MSTILNNKQVIRIKLYAKYITSKNTNYYDQYNNKKRNIVVALAADYGNLGDVAITYAQTEFLRKNFPDAHVIDFPISKTFVHMKSLKSAIKPNDIITIVGGGNTGDLYDDIEFARQFVIRQFPHNKIICFPQTIDFSNTPYGKKSFRKAIRVYSRHKDLTLSAREQKSYQILKQNFINNKIIFAPDIVLSLDNRLPDFQREGITLCLREDKEKRIDKNRQEELIEMISSNKIVRFQDTCITKSLMSVKERKEELDSIWMLFKKSELVITDRLHGMIFCAITDTPCLAFDNSNKKVSGVYNAWLSKNERIQVIENDDLKVKLELINKMINNENKLYSSFVHKDAFDDLIK